MNTDMRTPKPGRSYSSHGPGGTWVWHRQSRFRKSTGPVKATYTVAQGRPRGRPDTPARPGGAIISAAPLIVAPDVPGYAPSRLTPKYLTRVCPATVTG